MKCDLAVAIFKTRFGTPTDQYGSESEEEIEIMLNAGKQVFLFFDESPVEHDKIDVSQLQKVRDFKDKYKEQKRGILWEYKSAEEFRNIFNAQITRYFIISQTEEIKKLFKRIPQYNLTHDNYSAVQIFEKPEKLPEDVIKWISVCADKLGYKTLTWIFLEMQKNILILNIG